MSDSDLDDKFKPVQSEDVSDLKLLPGQFRQFAADVRLSFELLNERLMPMLNRLEHALDDLNVRVTRIEKDALAADRRLNAIEQQLSVAKRKQQARKRK